MRRTYAPDADCRGYLNNSGAVYIFRGATGALPSNQPAFVFYGPYANQTVRMLAGGFDHNGDGKGDVALGALEWDRAGAASSGGVAVLLGRGADPTGKVVVICDPDLLMHGDRPNDYLGRGMAGAGDLDGDGCDELAIGAPLVDTPGNQGAVRVVFGAGGASCPATATMTVLASGAANAQAGFRVAGGHDIDGDQVPDLAIGGPQYRVGAVPHGAVWVVSGASGAQLPREPLAEVPTTRHPFSDAMDMMPRLLIGPTPRGQYGGDVALAPSPTPGGTAMVAIGAWDADYAGAALAGGALVWRMDPVDGWHLVAGFGGESARSMGRLGRTMAAGLIGGRQVVVVGGPFASSVGLDQGAVFTLDLGL